MTPAQEQEAFDMIWDGLTTQSKARPTSSPKGFVLGGQPGAGKSKMVSRLGAELNRNLLVINGDEFRRYHPNFDEIQARYGRDAPQHTAAFSSKMTEMVLDRALREKYNVSIEGTFRTDEVPMGTLDKMRLHGYETAVHILTTPSEVSWQSTLERYNNMVEVGEQPRHTDKAHHDMVANRLAENADTVFASGKADSFKVYTRDGLVFDDKIHKTMPGASIDIELHRNSRQLEHLEVQYQKNAHRLSDSQKFIAKEAKRIIAELNPADQVQAKISLYSSQLAELNQKPPSQSPPSPSEEPEIER